jgi:hypothetical protein
MRAVRLPQGVVGPLVGNAVEPAGGTVRQLAYAMGVVRPSAMVAEVPALRHVLMGESIGSILDKIK